MLIKKSTVEKRYLIFALTSLIVIDSLRYLGSNGFHFQIGTYLSTFLQYISILVFIRFAIHSNLNDVSKVTKVLFSIFLLYLLVNIFRGFLLANNYWDYKFLFLKSITFTLVALVFYLGKNIFAFRLLVRVYIKYLLFLILITLPFTYFISQQNFSRLALPAVPLLLLTPFLKKKWTFYLILVVLLSVITNLTFRSNIIKIVISLLILSLYYFKFLRLTFNKALAYIAILVLPIILVIAGLFFNYNVFEEMSSNDDLALELENKSTGEIQKQNADTRTFLYFEVITDLVKNKALIFGKSPSQSYRTNFFFNTGGAIDNNRYASEVNILNILLHHGLFGVFLFMALILSISYLGIFKSNNLLAVMCGFLLLSRYLLSFIEEFTLYDFNFFFFWMFMGLVASNKFRAMTDKEIKIWVRGFLDKEVNKKYVKLLKIRLNQSEA